MGQRHCEDFEAPLCRRIKIRRIGNRILRVHVRPRIDQDPRSLDVIGTGREQQRGPPLAVARIQRCSDPDEASNGVRIAKRGGISKQFGIRGRHEPASSRRKR